MQTDRPDAATLTTRSDIREIAAADFPPLAEALAVLLHACVHAGASVNFILPFPMDEARAFWEAKGRIPLERRTRRLWVALAEGRVAGCVMLDRDLPPNQTHRAEVTKLLVHPDARRRGIAGALMAALLDGARQAGHALLTLDTTSGSPAQGIYEAAGFTVAGSIPDYSRAPLEDRLEATTYMYLKL